ncbi:glycosyl hydrolase 53 family protein [Undibacterium sp. RuTC16W]|uniref:glycosyl hydrolase 53 family protein n=1 Tax=Undibacterium sp. RuTC16W TaxID=3413048 RepID=UPI003BEFEED5
MAGTIACFLTLFLAPAALAFESGDAAQQPAKQNAEHQHVNGWFDQGDAGVSNIAQVNVDVSAVLRHSASHSYRVTSYQQLEGLRPGYYTLRAKAKSSGGQSSCFVFAQMNGFTQARTSLPAANDFREIVIPGIPALDGKLVIGIHSHAHAGEWAELDQIQLSRDDVAKPFLTGGDVSALTLMEKHGAQYTDRYGQQKDALKILQENGNSIVRLRLYESPGRGKGADGYYWPEGSMDLPDLLSMARRAAGLGMQIQLTFHYSDFWTNSTTQALPSQWKSILQTLPDEAAKMKRLRELVYERTREVMLALQAQGTPPQFVSLGNEVESGMLYPYGEASDNNWPRLASLFQAGYTAVKSVTPASQVVIHLDDAGNFDKYFHYFDRAKALGVQWDVIGVSYYPFWTKKTISDIVEFSNVVTARYNKDLLVMETGFNWNPTLPNGKLGQLSDNGPYPTTMSSPSGQRLFINELFNGLKLAKESRVIGVLYWDPIFIATPGIGWALRESDDAADINVVSNTTLFDFSGHALPVLDVWRDHAASVQKANPDKSK